MYLVCSLVKNCPLLGLLLFTCPPILVLRHKNAVIPSLPFISLKDLPFDFLLYYFVNLLIKRFGFLPDQASVKVVLFLSQNDHILCTYNILFYLYLYWL